MTPMPAPEATEVKRPARAKQIVRLALEDLARRMGVVPEAIQLVSVEAVEWSDTSLGCPQKGMMYAQVITPGYRVVLGVESRRYEYHTDAGQSVVFCEEEYMIPEPTVPSTVEPGLEGLVSLAKEDLAQRLSIGVEQIEVLEAKFVVWPDASLGCPQPGMAYRQVQRDGSLIRLSVEGRVYEYHSGAGRQPFLCQ